MMQDAENDGDALMEEVTAGQSQQGDDSLDGQDSLLKDEGETSQADGMEVKGEDDGPGPFTAEEEDTASQEGFPNRLSVPPFRGAGIDPAAAGVENGGSSDMRRLRGYDADDSDAIQTFLYKSGTPLPDLNPYLFRIIEVRVPAQDLTTNNKAFLAHRCWGCEVYTNDSDLVCVLQHMGFKRLGPEPPPDIAGVSVYIKVLRGRALYPQATRNGIRSRRFTGESPQSLRIVRVDDLLDSLGTEEEMEIMLLKLPRSQRSRKRRNVAGPNQRLAADLTMTFNLCNEPSIKYSLSEIADKGLDVSQWTCFRLTREVLYVETQTERYELTQEGLPVQTPLTTQAEVPASAVEKVASLPADASQSSQPSKTPVTPPVQWKKYRFSKVLRPREVTHELLTVSRVPLEEHDSDGKKRLEVLATGVDWADIAFGRDCMSVKGVFYGPFHALQFFPAHEAAPAWSEQDTDPKAMTPQERALWLLLSSVEQEEASGDASESDAAAGAPPVEGAENNSVPNAKKDQPTNSSQPSANAKGIPDATTNQRASRASARNTQSRAGNETPTHPSKPAGASGRTSRGATSSGQPERSAKSRKL